MSALSTQAWAQLRAEWELGAFSTRALATRHGVSEKAIRKHATNRRDPWRRDPAAATRASVRGRSEMLRALAAGRSASEVRIEQEVLATERAGSEARLADVIVSANLRHLDLATKLTAVFDLAHVRLGQVLAGEGAARARLAGAHGGVGTAMLALARLAVAIQSIEWKALGMDKPGQGSGATHADLEARSLAAFNTAALTTEQAALLAEAVAVLRKAQVAPTG